VIHFQLKGSPVSYKQCVQRWSCVMVYCFGVLKSKTDHYHHQYLCPS